MNTISKYRNDLHQIPELGLKEFKTFQYLKKTLENIGYQPIKILDTGLLVYIDNGNSETIAFRSDIDGLKIFEQSANQYQSTHEGYMHACGHDGHMAILLEFANQLSSLKNKLKVNILLIFQPAEESPGGANLLIKEGILNKYKVKKIFGSHLYPNIAEGTLASRSGNFMARSSEIDFEIIGKSAHGAEPENGVNATLIASEFIVTLENILNDEIRKIEPAVLTIGFLTSGTARNIISGSAKISGIIRSFQPSTHQLLKNRIFETIKTLEKKYNCEIINKIVDTYPAVINDATTYNFLKENVFSKFPYHEFENPFMLAEDFSFYLEKIPGVLFYLGTKSNKYNHPLHSSKFDFNNDALITVVKAYFEILKAYQGME